MAIGKHRQRGNVLMQWAAPRGVAFSQSSSRKSALLERPFLDEIRGTAVGDAR